jgi:hypothetical protein
MDEKELIIYHLVMFAENISEHYPHTTSIQSTIKKELEKYIKELDK